jgi:hypothetical protein
MSFRKYPIYRVDVDANPPRLMCAVVMSEAGPGGWRDVEIGGQIRRMQIGDWHRSQEDAWSSAAAGHAMCAELVSSKEAREFHWHRYRRMCNSAYEYFREQGSK